MTTPSSLVALLDRQYPGAYELDITASKSVILTIVHESLAGKARVRLKKSIEKVIQQAGLVPGILELYSPDEAKDAGVVLDARSEVTPIAWAEASHASGRPLRGDAVGASRSRFKRVVFYSYKGGVGRSTALVQTAFHLARQGKRVVVVDIDVEAPGLHQMLPSQGDERPSVGLVDYLWERQVKPDDLPATTSIVGGADGIEGISYSVEDPVSRAQVSVIPAGYPDERFISRVQALSLGDMRSSAKDAWTAFEKELSAQIDPDFVLIDSRTGLSEWGGLSLLRLADEVFLVMFPSAQNAEGIRFVKRVLVDARGIVPRIVFSPVPEGVVGDELIDRVSQQVLDSSDAAPVRVLYSQGVAAAQRFPIESAMIAYQSIANAILEREAVAAVENSLSKADRWKVLESLSFAARDAKSIASSDFEEYFQKTSDFEKVLDDARWVVRGRKGTGKSTLFHLFVEHQDNAAKRARGRIDNVEILPGHGPTPAAHFRPSSDDFLEIHRVCASRGLDWLSFWRAYAVVRMHVCSFAPLQQILLKPEANRIRVFFRREFKVLSSATWKSSHTVALIDLLSGDLAGSCRDLLVDVNDELALSGRKLWLLYDDLDQDIREGSSWHEDAIGGLLRLAYDLNNRDLHDIRLKVFLREDVWSKLVFTNKSHFGEPRTVLLQWRIEDFLRLAYRLAAGGSRLFRSLASTELPLSDGRVDAASEDELQRALAPLWGLSQEKGKKTVAAKWVYSRLTDARENTYPRSLTVLLESAKNEELRIRSRNPPSDRLLSAAAMQAGLKAASVERVDAVKNEYPKLTAFLDDVVGKASLRSQFGADELQTVWDRTSRKFYPTFDAFVAGLEEAGMLVRKRGSAYDYGFASLYIDGLGVTRVQGEKK